LLLQAISIRDLLLDINHFLALLLHLVDASERETATKATYDNKSENRDYANHANTGSSSNSNSDILSNGKYNTITLIFSRSSLLVNKFINICI